MRSSKITQLSEQEQLENPVLSQLLYFVCTSMGINFLPKNVYSIRLFNTELIIISRPTTEKTSVIENEAEHCFI